jgi:hypothetical protein
MPLENCTSVELSLTDINFSRPTASVITQKPLLDPPTDNSGFWRLQVFEI